MAGSEHEACGEFNPNTSPQRHEVHEEDAKSGAWGASAVHPAGDGRLMGNLSIVLRVLCVFVA